MTERGTPAVVWLMCAVTVALGLVFTFVKAPHPFGWEGIDHYHDLAIRLARGEPFPTTDVPWGYAAFVALVYRIAGPRAWAPVTVQVLLNGLVPLLTYRLVRRELDDRAAIVATLLVGIFSFNTVYASTESSDSLCTLIVLASLVALAEGLDSGRAPAFVASGLLAGAAAQFRPNLLLLPATLAVVVLIATRLRRTIGPIALYIAATAAALMPWTIRNYRVTGELMPSSSHGGIQLWYGSLETGPYLRSRAHNPRSAFEGSAFDYSSLAGRSILVDYDSAACSEPAASRADLVYWSDRNPARVTVGPREGRDRTLCAFEIPAQEMRTTVYFYVRERADNDATVETPERGAADPFVFFVDDRHLADLDTHGDFVDIFDLVRAVRHVLWNEPMPFADRMDLDHDGTISERDVRLIASSLAPAALFDTDDTRDVVSGIGSTADAATLTFVDGSTLEVPRAWRDRITDLVPRGQLASDLCSEHRRIRSWRKTGRRERDVSIDQVFYRREPHMMRRYTALAFDNIERDPTGFALASAYRAFRLFIVAGSSDVHTAQQFEGSSRVYRLATTLSAVVFTLGVAGIAIAFRQRRRPWLLLVPIVYIPATICFVLVNTRYTTTVQPLLFAFVAVALTARFTKPYPSVAPS
jgi:hypothetical protein